MFAYNAYNAEMPSDHGICAYYNEQHPEKLCFCSANTNGTDPPADWAATEIKSH